MEEKLHHDIINEGTNVRQDSLEDPNSYLNLDRWDPTAAHSYIIILDAQQPSTVGGAHSPPNTPCKSLSPPNAPCKRPTAANSPSRSPTPSKRSPSPTPPTYKRQMRTTSSQTKSKCTCNKKQEPHTWEGNTNRSIQESLLSKDDQNANKQCILDYKSMLSKHIKTCEEKCAIIREGMEIPTWQSSS